MISSSNNYLLGALVFEVLCLTFFHAVTGFKIYDKGSSRIYETAYSETM